ncbi:hypothetical protein PR048_019444 [Dryococelus australis]|uniref:Fibronectin type-III domain-containing protein n=1 Tax=Dryococelus australis TaxID=614101 RepID=A0ABQ9H3K2_9NEOP|nr:hypothetical protein PR048_019444 [Dryococelus australis]
MIEEMVGSVKYGWDFRREVPFPLCHSGHTTAISNFAIGIRTCRLVHWDVCSHRLKMRQKDYRILCMSTTLTRHSPVQLSKSPPPFAMTTAAMLCAKDFSRDLNNSGAILNHNRCTESHNARISVRTSLSTASQMCPIGLRSGDLGGQANNRMPLECSTNYSLKITQHTLLLRCHKAEKQPDVGRRRLAPRMRTPSHVSPGAVPAAQNVLQSGLTTTGNTVTLQWILPANYSNTCIQELVVCWSNADPVSTTCQTLPPTATFLAMAGLQFCTPYNIRVTVKPLTGASTTATFPTTTSNYALFLLSKGLYTYAITTFKISITGNLTVTINTITTTMTTVITNNLTITINNIATTGCPCLMVVAGANSAENVSVSRLSSSSLRVSWQYHAERLNCISRFLVAVCDNSSQALTTCRRYPVPLATDVSNYAVAVINLQPCRVYHARVVVEPTLFNSVPIDSPEIPFYLDGVCVGTLTAKFHCTHEMPDSISTQGTELVFPSELWRFHHYNIGKQSAARTKPLHGSYLLRRCRLMRNGKLSASSRVRTVLPHSSASRLPAGLPAYSRTRDYKGDIVAYSANSNCTCQQNGVASSNMFKRHCWLANSEVQPMGKMSRRAVPNQTQGPEPRAPSQQRNHHAISSLCPYLLCVVETFNTTEVGFTSMTVAWTMPQAGDASCQHTLTACAVPVGNGRQRCAANVTSPTTTVNITNLRPCTAYQLQLYLATPPGETVAIGPVQPTYSTGEYCSSNSPQDLAIRLCTRLQCDRCRVAWPSENGAAPECTAGETGDPRENPPSSGIVRHDYHVSGSLWWEGRRVGQSVIHNVYHNTDMNVIFPCMAEETDCEHDDRGKSSEVLIVLFQPRADTSSCMVRHIIVLEYPILPRKDNHHVWVDVIAKDGFITKSIKSAFYADDRTYRIPRDHSPDHNTVHTKLCSSSNGCRVLVLRRFPPDSLRLPIANQQRYIRHTVKQIPVVFVDAPMLAWVQSPTVYSGAPFTEGFAELWRYTRVWKPPGSSRRLSVALYTHFTSPRHGPYVVGYTLQMTLLASDQNDVICLCTRIPTTYKARRSVIGKVILLRVTHLCKFLPNCVHDPEAAASITKNGDRKRERELAVSLELSISIDCVRDHSILQRNYLSLQAMTSREYHIHAHCTVAERRLVSSLQLTRTRDQVLARWVPLFADPACAKGYRICWNETTGNECEVTATNTTSYTILDLDSGNYVVSVAGIFFDDSLSAPVTQIARISGNIFLASRLALAFSYTTPTNSASLQCYEEIIRKHVFDIWQ